MHTAKAQRDAREREREREREQRKSEKKTASPCFTVWIFSRSSLLLRLLTLVVPSSHFPSSHPPPLSPLVCVIVSLSFFALLCFPASCFFSFRVYQQNAGSTCLTEWTDQTLTFVTQMLTRTETDAGRPGNAITCGTHYIIPLFIE